MRPAHYIEKTLAAKFLDKFPIFGSHIQRIGFFRVFVGTMGMLMSIPFILVSHVIFVEIVLQRLLSPLLKLKTTETRHYIFMDRHLIEGLPVIDKFICSICSYASGTFSIIIEKLSQIEAIDLLPPLYGTIRNKLAATVLLGMFPIVCLVSFVGLDIIYRRIIEKPLGIEKAGDTFLETVQNFGNIQQNTNRLIQRCLRFYRLKILTAFSSIVRIESSWCPLKHPKVRPDISYPRHHEAYFKPYEIDEMQEFLKKEGTALNRVRTEKRFHIPDWE